MRAEVGCLAPVWKTLCQRIVKEREVRRREGKKARERNVEPRDIKSYTAAGPDIRKVWMIRGCQHSQIAALLTASTTSLVWPSSAVPPLLNAK